MLARPAGLEPTTPGLEGRCSIRLSYGRLERHCRCAQSGGPNTLREIQAGPHLLKARNILCNPLSVNKKSVFDSAKKSTCGVQGIPL